MGFSSIPSFLGILNSSKKSPSARQFLELHRKMPMDFSLVNSEEENIYQKLLLAVADHLKKIQIVSFQIPGQTDGKVPMEREEGMTDEIWDFLKKESNLYQMLLRLLENKKCFKARKIVLDFLKIDLACLKRLFYWAHDNDKHDGFLLDCFFLKDWKDEIFKSNSKADKTEDSFLDDLFLFSITVEDKTEDQIEKHEKMILELLENVVDESFLKKGIHIAIAENDPDLGLKIFEHLITLLPEKIDKKELENILEDITDQKTIFQSYKIWTNLEQAVQNELFKRKENKLFFVRSSSIDDIQSKGNLRSFSAPAIESDFTAAVPKKKYAVVSMNRLVKSPTIKKNLSDLADCMGSLSLDAHNDADEKHSLFQIKKRRIYMEKLSDKESMVPKIRMPKLKLEALQDKE